MKTPCDPFVISRECLKLKVVQFLKDGNGIRVFAPEKKKRRDIVGLRTLGVSAYEIYDSRADIVVGG